MAMTQNLESGFEDPSGQYSLRSVLTVIFKRWRTIVACTLSVLAVVIAYFLNAPEVYVAKASLLVNKNRAEVALAPVESLQLVTHVSEQDMNSEVEVLKSRELIEEVVEILRAEGEWLPQDEGSGRGEQQGSLGYPIRSAPGERRLPEFDQMVLALSYQIQINLVKKSNVIEVRYPSTDPDWATRVVKTFTERYIERRADRGQAREAVAFFEGQMQQAEERLKGSEEVLEKYLTANQFTLSKGPQGSDSLSNQKTLVLSRLARLQDERSDAEARIQELTRKIENLETRMVEEPERLQSSAQMNQDAVTQIIKQQLTILELERDALLQDFRPDSRYVRDIETQIDLARERLAEVQAEIGQIDGTEFNPIHQGLKEELLRSEAELEGARARYYTLGRLVDEHKVELENLNQKAFELESLHREVQAAEEQYLLYRKKREEARISAAMDQERLINVSIVEPARRPLTPVGGDLKNPAIIALFAGLLGGLALAFGTDLYLNHSFTTGEEIERRLGIPHIASIPDRA
jgi:uncharacterized protein involved in exopolysaccharide biosynthesis